MSIDRGTQIALAAGLWLVAACRDGGGSARKAPAQDERQALVNCQGANACKAKSLCHTAKNMCAGQNACKGQGWIDLPRAACEAAGGTIVHVTR